MSFGIKSKSDLKSISPPGSPRRKGAQDLATLSPRRKRPRSDAGTVEQRRPSDGESGGEVVFKEAKISGGSEAESGREPLGYADEEKARKARKSLERDVKLLKADRWLIRNGHALSFIGLFLFSVIVLYRPYELAPGLGFLSRAAFYLALVTLAFYIPSQLAAEGNLTYFSTEVQAALVLAGVSLVTMPLAKDPGLAWVTFNDTFSKAVIMFIVMVNVIRTRARLTAMIWLSLSIAVTLSVFAIKMFLAGEMTVEGYRVKGEIGGMFENPNELSLHLVMMFPLALALGLASRNILMRAVYLSIAFLLVGANMLTYSRGGFLAFAASCAVLVWKYGRKSRTNVTVASAAAGFLLLLAAPGNYLVRILSIFGITADPVGSSDQRRELLERSILVSLRNPWGIGLGNFPIVGIRNLVTHNGYTQVSSELGLVGLGAYLVLIISPFRKLGAIERIIYSRKSTGWFYHLCIGLQASIVAYLVGSFFASVAYNWFIYYIIAYAVAFRRIYDIEHTGDREPEIGSAPVTSAA